MRSAFYRLSQRGTALAHPTTSRFRISSSSCYGKLADQSSLPAHNDRRCMFSSSSTTPSSGGSGSDDDYNNTEDPHAMFKEQMEQLKDERENMFGFTEDEEDSWSNLTSGKEQLPTSLMESVKQARDEYNARTVESPDPYATTTETATASSSSTSSSSASYSEPSHGLTHLSEDGSSVNMVDVGDKAITQRMARAETRVIFPPEVVEAFQKSQNGGDTELVGPKGPIFATAKIAGIMAAKKTSDLIPLCHPLPLDKVQLDIRLETPSVVVISCECRVTHKTGVEMEALTGASVAALTIYDMVKAISHNIRIEQTVLIGKSGGKRQVG